MTAATIMPGFRCQRCGQSLLHTQAQAGSPPRGFWVTLEDGRFGFDCPAGPGGHEPPSRTEVLEPEGPAWEPIENRRGAWVVYYADRSAFWVYRHELDAMRKGVEASAQVQWLAEGESL